MYITITENVDLKKEKKGQKLCVICNFDRDLWIFFESELIDKPKKI